MPPLRIDITGPLQPFTQELQTRCLRLEQDLLVRSGPVLRPHLPQGTWLMVADQTTWQVAGGAVRASLEQAGVPVLLHLVRPAPGESDPVADDLKVAAVRQQLEESGCSAAVAVGSGTVNDLVKAAADDLHLPYAVIATAPSMNGYTSSIAALLSHGVKTTRSCRPAVACLVDLDVMAAAPYRMIASGLGDLISKPVSNADWRLAYRLLGDEYAVRVMPLMDAGAAFLEGITERLPTRDMEAVGRLSASLCISGLAMGLAGSSAPSSGGEHLISHYLDMTHFAWGESHDLHGCQVGVATLTTAALYECLGSVDPRQIDIQARVARQPTWDTYSQQVRQRFGSLSEAVLEHARCGHPEPDELGARLRKLQRDWSVILEDVHRTLRPARELAARLRRAQCPTSFAQIGVAPERARRAVLHSKDIRARYTILHLGMDLGLLETWATRILPAARA